MTRRPARAGAGALAALGAAATALGLWTTALPASAAEATSGVGGLSGAGEVSGVPLEPAQTEPGTGLPVTVLVTEVAPRVLQPGQDLVVRVRVRNDSGVEITQPRVALSIDRTAFIGRLSLDRWRDAEPTAAVGSELVTADLPGPLAPGQQTTVELVAAPGRVALPNRASSWGARGIAVTVTDLADAARTRLGIARTFALWFPEQEVNATRVSVLAPVVGPAADATTQAWVPALEEATADGGRLATVLEATAASPGVTWLLDPWLLEATDAGGPGAQAWGDALAEAMTDREVQLLPYLDADLAALAHAGRADLAGLAIGRGEATAGAFDLPDASRVTLALPAVDEPDLATADLAGDADLALVVGPGVLAPPAVLTYTPSGRSTVVADGASVTVLVPDARLSSALSTGRLVPPPDPGDDEGDDEGDDVPAEAPAPATPPTTALTPATAAQDLLAELAVITRERPNDARHVLATVPRDWTPDVAVTRAQLEALADAPWVRLEPVSALVGLADPEIDRGTLPARAAEDSEVTRGEMTALTAALERRASLVSMLTDPASSLGDPELETLAPLSVAWRADTAGRAWLVNRARASTEVLADAITVTPTTPDGINVLSTSADLPVNIANGLDEDVSVVVRLRPDDPRLRARDTVEVTVPAESQVLVQVPVHAVSSADVSVTVEVLTPDGEVVDDDTSFLVRVRAEWEGIGTAIIASLLALFFVVGIVRTVRRGRGARRAAPEPDAGPDALSPEEELSPEDDEAEARP